MIMPVMNKIEAIPQTQIPAATEEISSLIEKITLKKVPIKSILKFNLGMAYFIALVFFVLKLILT
jgi:hypothetical protein